MKHAQPPNNALVAVLLFLAGTFYIGSGRSAVEDVISSRADRNSFRQEQFGPAVLAACGQGYTRPLSPVPGLDDFLQQRTDSFSCGSLPPGLVTEPAIVDVMRPYYLHLTAAWVWRVSGISWTALVPVQGFFFGLVVALSYLLSRVAMGRLLSLGVALAFLPIHLAYLPRLRDYSKAPFLLAILWVLALMIKGPINRRRLLGFSAAIGCLVGIGLGFRDDLRAAIPAFLIVLFFFLPVRPTLSIRLRLACALVFASAALLTHAPDMAVEHGMNPTPHYVLQGLATPFTEDLGLGPSIYEWSHLYTDRWPAIQVKAYAYLVEGSDTRIKSFLATYDAVAWRLLGDIVQHFPADLVTRVFAAISQITVIPLFIAGILFALCYRQPRQAVALFFVIIYFAGIPALQFHERHFFHLEIAPWWFLGLAIQASFDHGCDWFAAGRPPLRLARARLLTATAYAACGLLSIALPLGLLRVIQNNTAQEFLSRYHDTALTALPLAEVPTIGNKVLITSLTVDDLLELPTAPGFRVGYLVIDLSGERCRGRNVGLFVRYAGQQLPPWKRLSRPWRVGLGPGRTRLFVPIHSWPDSRYLGIEVSREDLDCVTGFSMPSDLATAPPLLWISFDQDWRQRGLYQRFEAGSGIASVWLKTQEITAAWQHIVAQWAVPKPRRLDA